MIDRPFLIVGAGSSGSTLLSVLLDHHPRIACGPELSVFNKKKIYGDYFIFQSMLQRRLSKGLSTNGHAEYRPFFFNLSAYFWTEKQLIELADSCDNYYQFFCCFFERYLKKRDKKIWGEKTGSNAYCVDEFVKLFPKARIIHLVRDGRDAFCSLAQRPGNSFFHSASHWLYNAAAAYRFKDMNYYLELRYEDLVSQPDNQLRRICDFLEVEYDAGMLSGKEPNQYWQFHSKNNVHVSWKHNPIQHGVSTKSVGRHQKEMTPEAENLFWHVRLTPPARRKLNIQYCGTQELMKALGYIDTFKPYGVPVRAVHLVDAIQRWWSRFKRELRYENRLWIPLTYLRLWK
jgi:hypothetical protein